MSDQNKFYNNFLTRLSKWAESIITHVSNSKYNTAGVKLNLQLYQGLNMQ